MSATSHRPPHEIFAALANASRLRCLLLLESQGELCVCELTHALALSQPHVSRHLGQLRESGLVSDRRVGTWVYYRIHEDLPPWARAVLTETARGTLATAPFHEDLGRLSAMPNRPGLARCA